MNYYVLKSIEFGPSVIRRIFAKMDASRYDEHLDPDRFSPREAIAHLADWEPIFRGRMELIRSEPGAFIVGEDESERAIQNRYHEQDIVANLRAFEEERRKTTALVRSLGPEEWSLLGEREGYGSMTIENFANLLVCHDMYHVDQLLEFIS
jgi:hypothetical protein